MTESTHHEATIEVEITEAHHPVQLDLNQIFGAIGLRYAVAIESYGIVSAHQPGNESKLYLSAGAHAEVGSQTRLVVRADDGTGCTAAVIFKVAIIQAAAEVARVA